MMQQVLFAGKNAFLFAMPHEDNRAARFEPLERMRSIVPNVLACMRAAVPNNSWQRVFSGYYLPSPLGPNKTGQPEAQKLFKEHLLSIFQNAKVDPKKTLDEVMKLLPYAEHMHKEGLGIRESWAAASRDNPHLTLARDAVNLLICNKHTTGSVERMLRVVTAQRDAERGLLSRDALRDVFLADVLGPKGTEVVIQEAAGPFRSSTGGTHHHGPAHTITPKGPYLSKILKAYRLTFGGRNFKRQPKKRRDFGIARSEADLERKQRRAKTTTEAAFLRRREKDMKATVAMSAEERGRKRKISLVGGEVPPDTEKYVSEAIKTVCAKAGVRQVRKSKRNAATVKKPDAKGKVRWLGERSSDQAVCSSQPRLRNGTQAVQILVPRSGLHQNLLCARRFEVYTSESWLKFGAAALAGRKSIMVVPGLDASGLQENPMALLSRVCGMHLTTSSWLADAFRRNEAPKAMTFRGLVVKKEMHIWVSPELRSLEVEFDILKLVVQAKTSHWRLVETRAKLRKIWDKYLTVHGPRSRPSVRICALAKSEAEKKALAKEKDFVGHDSILQTLDDFLSQQSPVISNTPCPGKWEYWRAGHSK